MSYPYICKEMELKVKAAALEAAITNQHPPIESPLGQWLASGSGAAAEWAGLIAQYRIIIHKRKHGDLEEPCPLFDEALAGALLEQRAAEERLSAHGGDSPIGCPVCLGLAITGSDQEVCGAGAPLAAEAKRLRMRRSMLYFCENWVRVTGVHNGS